MEYSGSSDPDRLLPLLWRKRRPTSPQLGRRPRLSVDAVLDAAIALADAEGLQVLSMNRLATALSVGTMTLYTYVPSKGELIDLMVDEVLSERELPGPGEPRPDGWRSQLDLYVELTRAMYRTHPWLRQVSTIRPPIGPGMLAESEYVLSTLADIGLTPTEMDAAAYAITLFVNSAAQLEAESEQLERATHQSNDSWWQDRMTLWEDYFDVERHPTMTQIWNSGGFNKGTAEGAAAGREFGFQRLLDGIEASVNK